MFDLTKLLNEDHNLTAINPTRIAISAPTAPPMLIPKRSQTNSFLVSTSEGMQLDMDDTFSAPQTTPSSSLGPFGNGSSYGASPLAQTSPSTWDQRYTIVKQETDGPGLALSGGQAVNLSPGGSEYFNLQNAGPTLAQLNSPPNEDLITLKAFDRLTTTPHPALKPLLQIITVHLFVSLTLTLAILFFNWFDHYYYILNLYP
jgi:hypothetical protein